MTSLIGKIKKTLKNGEKKMKKWKIEIDSDQCPHKKIWGIYKGDPLWCGLKKNFSKEDECNKKNCSLKVKARIDFIEL